MGNPTRDAVLERTSGWQVVYCGAKATDAARLRHLGKDLTVLSVVGTGSDIGPDVDGLSVEELAGRRPDYDRFSWDTLDRGLAERIVSYLEAKRQDSPVLLVPFAASRLFSNLALTLDNLHLAGNFVLIEQAFNHKPWAEAEMRREGVPVAPWQHCVCGHAHASTRVARRWLTRLPASTGGLGMHISDSARDAQDAAMLSGSGDIASICPYFEEAIPLNVNACVFPSGRATVHPLSVQIIGAGECTDRQFGYCGNDFGAALVALDDREFKTVEDILVRVGAILRRRGYIGAYGLDLMKTDEGILVSEINPRFQASSYVGSQLEADAGLPDIYMDHVAAHLGLEPCEPRPSLGELVRTSRPLSQVFCYNVTSDTADTAAPTLGMETSRPDATDLVLRRRPADHHALLFRLIVNEGVLGDNWRLTASWRARVTETKRATLAGLS